MSELAIQVENLGKQYRLGPRVKYQALRDTLADALRAPLRLFAGKGKEQEQASYLWALRNISFDVEHGEVLGIIGRNGAGKSTLLKILSRISEPTEGLARIHGRLGSLLEVGTGFHPELTGRENIFLNGAILGMKRVEIARKFDEIAAFAEVEQSLDTPVKHYSSGMYMRLAFAVAAHLEPEILVVDEVLAVGDAAFQKKCLGKMGEVAQAGRTILFVSHDMAAIQRLCKRALWIDAGKLHREGEAREVAAEYLSSNLNETGQVSWPEGVADTGVDEFKLYALRVMQDGRQNASVDCRKPFYVEMEYCIQRPVTRVRIGLHLHTADGIHVFDTYDADTIENFGNRAPGRYTGRVEIPGRLLNAGRYIVSLRAGMPRVKPFIFLESVLGIHVEDALSVGAHYNINERRGGVILPSFKWETRKA